MLCRGIFAWFNDWIGARLATSDLTQAAAFFPAKVTFGSEALRVCLNNWMGPSQGKGRQGTRRSLFNYKSFLPPLRLSPELFT